MSSHGCAIGNARRAAAARERASALRKARSTQTVRQLYIDLKRAISDSDLFKVIRTTEAAGFTVRYPFLDHLLAEVAASIPANVQNEGKTSPIFFQAYADLLPVEILKKRNSAALACPSRFGSARSSASKMMHDLIFTAREVCSDGIFGRGLWSNLVQKHQTEESSIHATILWNLMILELWHRSNGNAQIN